LTGILVPQSRCIFAYMKRLCLIFFLAGMFGLADLQCQTHEIDSLKQLLYPALNQQKRIDLLNQLSYQWMNINFDSAKRYANEAYQKAVAIGHVPGQIKAILRQCSYYLFTGDNRTALGLIKRSELLADKIGNNELLTSAYMIHGDILTNISMYEMAIKYYFLALDLSEVTKNYEKKNLCLNRMGIVNSKTKNFDKALECYQKALKQVSLLKNTDEEFWLMNNIATIYSEQKKDKKALEMYQKILAAHSQNKQLKASVLYNIASTCASIGDTNKAISYYEKAYNLCEETGNVFLRTKVLLDQCALLIDQKKSSIVKEDLVNIFSASVISSWPDLAANSAKLLSAFYEKQHDLKQSLRYLSEYIKYSEIQESKENARKIAEIQLRYDLEKEALDIAAKSHRKSILIVFILIISLVCVCYILTLLVHFKTRAEKGVLRQKNLELEQERLKLEHQNMVNKLELSNKEVVSNAILLSKKNDLLSSVTEKLSQISDQFTKPNKDIIGNFVKELQQSIEEPDWESIEKPFNQIYESFYKNLDVINPNLTTNDKRLCAYIKLKMRSKEIARITSSTPRSVEIARYRLRKKLGITDPLVSLNGFLEHL